MIVESSAVYCWKPYIKSKCENNFYTNFDIRPEILKGKKWIATESGALLNISHYTQI